MRALSLNVSAALHDEHCIFKLSISVLMVGPEQSLIMVDEFCSVCQMRQQVAMYHGMELTGHCLLSVQ